MAIRTHSGKFVVAGVIVLAVLSTFLLKVLTSGTPSDLRGPASPGATPRGTVTVRPTSGPATPGRSVRVDIDSSCGFDAAVDFDGAFWVPGNGRSLASVGRKLVAPVDPASVTLQAEDSALLRTAAGQVVVLVRSRSGTASNPVC
jgi:hypothetical protein